MTISVKKVTGIGPKTAEFLLEKNIETAEGLIEFGTEMLAEAPGFSPGRAETVMAAARQLLGLSKLQKEVAKSAAGGKSKDKKKDKKDKGKKGKGKKGKKDKKKDKKKNKKDKKNKK